MNRVNPDITNDFISAINNSQLRVQQALLELSSGKRVNNPSDDPAAFALMLQNHAQSAQLDQYVQNSSAVLSQLQTADSALSSVVTSLNQAITIGTQGANATVSASDRQQLAASVLSIRDQIIQLANLSFHGRYVFAGSATTTLPFAVDPSSPSGVTYYGNQTTNSVEIAEGRSIQVNLPGDFIFMQPGADVMGSLTALAAALQTGTTANISAAINQVSSALSNVSEQRIFYGTAISQINATEAFLQQESVNLKSEENTLVGADIAAVATQLNSAQTSYNGVLAAIAKIMPQSLLNYLK